MDKVFQKAVELSGVGADWVEPLRLLASKESSLNPRAVNQVSVGGENATGLMQTLPSTFQQHAMTGYGDIYNPLDNLLASISYIKGRYGHPSVALQGWEQRGGY
ncbi:MAG: transglycosylase SLT domain-containing protein [Bacteroidales bacterium]|nr:transglycosylase SLT domain-containing protein [Bacteroidales bacterium]